VDENKTLISDEKYTNFEIQFDWKLSPNSNSGFMWGVIEDSRIDAPSLTRSLYDMVTSDHLMTKPAGDWNRYQITINYRINKGTVAHSRMEINRFSLLR